MRGRAENVTVNCVVLKTGEKTMKAIILAAVVISAVALGACRREEPAPMKLGADINVEAVR